MRFTFSLNALVLANSRAVETCASVGISGTRMVSPVGMTVRINSCASGAGGNPNGR